MKRIGMVLLATLCLYSCTGNAKRMSADRDSSKIVTNNINELVMNDDMVRKFLSNYYDNPDLSEEGMNMLIPYEWDFLKKHGLKPLSDKEFKERVQIVFNIDLDSANKYPLKVEHKYFHVYYYPVIGGEETGTEGVIDYSQLSGGEDFNICFVKRFNYLTCIQSPHVTLHISNDGKIFSNFERSIVYENQYVLHSNKAALTWLMANDGEFLNSLVEIFGYMGDKQLLEWYIKNHMCDFSYDGRRRDFEDFTKMITTRRPDGTFRFNQEILDVMNEDPKAYIDEVDSYSKCFWAFESEVDIDGKFPDFKEKTETVAHLLYWGENQPYDVTGLVHEFAFMGTFSEACKELDKYDAEFKRCNYYGLQDFEKQWKEAKIYGDGFGPPMR